MLWLEILNTTLAIFIFCVICFVEDKDLQLGACCGCFLTLSLSVSIALIIESINPRISTIDVYRGKTTLGITYRDSVAVDSVVVWKEE